MLYLCTLKKEIFLFRKLLFIVTILTPSLYAESFQQVNPAPTKTMQENIKNAQPCPNPAPATENISGEFKYGCFCGKNYPIIADNEPKAYKKLDKQERLEMIEEYYKVKPYDDIDAVCQQHDICYFYKGKNAKSCNEAIHHELRSLVDAFRKKKWD